jgi:hypothetical protein
MRKLFLIGLLIIAIPAICMAADSSHAARALGKIDQVVAIGDGSTDSLVEVSTSSGALNTADRAQAVSAGYGDRLVYTGACRLISVTVYGQLAGDYAVIYDGTTTAGTWVFDPSLTANTSSLTIDCKGAPMTTGIYVDAKYPNVSTSVVYDY